MPTKGKIILFAAFFVLLYVLFSLGVTHSAGQQCTMLLDGVACRDVSEISLGLPAFYIPEHFSGDAISSLFLPGMLLANIIIYYLVACAIMFVYNRKR